MRNKMVISKKQRLRLGVYGLLRQYGSRARNLSLDKFSKEIEHLSEHELDELAEKLHSTGWN